jgi:hypothetical protein
VVSQLQLAKELLHQLEIAQDNRALSIDELWLRNKLKKNCLALSSLSRTIARLRSRIEWLKKGDANTALLHAHLRYRKNKNFIVKVESSDGQTITTHEHKAVEFTTYYRALLGSHEDRDVTIDLDALGVLTHDLALLDSPFLEDEVWETIKRLPTNKAPGPNRFTGKFYKTCW